MSCSRLLTTDDWPEAELRAAVLAGELVPVGGCWASVAEPQDASLRAASFRWSTGDERMVAARRSAAWVWGACSRPPLPHDVAVPYAHRVRKRRPGLSVREVAIDGREVVRFGTTPVTSPLRTVVDLLRETDGWAAPTDVGPVLVRAMFALELAAAEEVAVALAALRRAPMARRAEARLAGLEPAGTALG